MSTVMQTRNRSGLPADALERAFQARQARMAEDERRIRTALDQTSERYRAERVRLLGADKDGVLRELGQRSARTRGIAALRTTLLASAFLSTAAFADDVKIINGGACYPTGWHATWILNRFSSITNLQGSDNIQVACPIVRDRRRGGGMVSYGSAAAVIVSVNGNGKPIQCQVQSHGEFGEPKKHYATSGGAAGPENLLIRIGESYDNGFYALQCVLPDRGRIYSYQIVEPSVTASD